MPHPAAPAIGALPPPQRPASAAELPDGLRDVTAVLAADNASAPGGRTLVYVLGMSHVSRRSVEHVDQLIRMVILEGLPDLISMSLTALVVQRTKPLLDVSHPSPACADCATRLSPLELLAPGF